VSQTKTVYGKKSKFFAPQNFELVWDHWLSRTILIIDQFL